MIALVLLACLGAPTPPSRTPPTPPAVDTGAEAEAIRR